MSTNDWVFKFCRAVVLTKDDKQVAVLSLALAKEMVERATFSNDVVFDLGPAKMGIALSKIDRAIESMGVQPCKQ